MSAANVYRAWRRAWTPGLVAGIATCFALGCSDGGRPLEIVIKIAADAGAVETGSGDIPADSLPDEDTTSVSDGGVDFPAPEAAPECVKFCDDYVARCGEANGTSTDGYLDHGTCLAGCAHFEPGIGGEHQGDTLSCRATTMALEPKAVFCAQGGPLALEPAGPGAFAGGVCGTDACEAFCKLAADTCMPTTNPPTWNGDMGFVACLHACGPSGDFDIDPTAGGASSKDGKNTLNCRMYQLQLAWKDPKVCTTLGSGANTPGPCAN